ncbi:MAG: hypothetical protein ACXVCP_12445 [Bdellovibrio sp.]
MKKFVLVAFSVSTLFLAGCATNRTAEAQRIVETDENAIKSCHLLGEVSGSSHYGGFAMQEFGKTNAKNEAVNQAVNMQATHLVWKKAEGGFFGAHALALAYNCNRR